MARKSYTACPARVRVTLRGRGKWRPISANRTSVKLVSYDRGYRNLKDDFDGV